MWHIGLRFSAKMSKSLMSSIAKISCQAEQADQLLKQLRGEVDAIRQNMITKAYESEQQKLEAENAELEKQVCDLKKQLIEIEVKNGVKQYSVPDQQPPPIVGSHPVQSKSNETKPSEQSAAAVVDQQPKKKLEKAEKPKKSTSAPDNELPVDVGRLNMRVGRIVSVKKHPDADTLYVEEVDVGEPDRPNRTIVSGLVKHIPLDQMQDRIAVFMCNLKPAKMRGVLSEGMIMCASTPDKVEILVPPSGCVPGDRVVCVGYETCTPDVELHPKKKVWEQVAPDMRTDAERYACYRGSKLYVGDKGFLMAPSLTDVQIK